MGGKGNFASMLGQLAMVLGKKGKGKGGRKGSSKPKGKFSDLPEEKKEEIRARHEERRQNEGREEAGDKFYFGTLLQRGKKYGWIKPSNFGKLPDEVQTKIKEMVKAKKANVKEHKDGNEVFNQSVLYVRMCDVEEGVQVSAGDKVKFKVYTDSEGAGAHEVTTA